jgi:hypothetical protein
MKKNTLLYILILVLLLVNGFFLFKHFGDKPDHERNDRKSQKNFIVRQLDFNDAQLQDYDSLKSLHREVMKDFDGEIRVLKDQFYSHLSNSNRGTSEIDSLATLISHKEKQKDLEIFNYLYEIRRICDDTQKEKLNVIIKDAINKRGGRDRSKRQRQ